MSLAFGFGLPHWQPLSGGFSPLSLFTGGIQGTWYDPSDYGSTGTGGVGTLFQDSAGTTPVTGVEQVVGLMLDKSQGLVLGSETVTNGGPFTVTTGWTGANGGALSVVSSNLRVTNTINDGGDATFSASAPTIGRWYKVQFTIVSRTINFASRIFFGGNTITGLNAGSYTYYFLATTTAALVLSNGATGAIGQFADYNNISVRELPGNHATSTGAARPTLRARYNLLTYSEEFDLWSGAGTTVTTNATTAPDSTATADKIVETAATSLHYRLIGSLSTQVTGYTLSVYGKAAERKWLILWYSGSGGFEPYAYFDLENGVVGSKSVSATASIVAAANGFYRCQITITGQAISNASFVVSVSDADNNNPNQTYLGDVTKGLFVWGAQLLTAADVTATGNAYQRIAAATVYDAAGFLPYLAFGGTQAMSSGVLSNFITAAAYETCIGSSLTAAAPTNNAVPWGNASCFMDGNSGYAAFGNVRSNNTIGIYNWDGGIDVVTQSLTPPSTFVLSGRHDAGNIVLGLNNGAESSAASGNTTLLNQNTTLMSNGVTAFMTGRLYSMIIRSTVFTASERAATIAWVNGKTGAY